MSSAPETINDVFPNIKCVSLCNPAPNGVSIEREDVFTPLINTLNEIHDRIERGEKVYFGITDGERKGSIAYVHSFDAKYQKRRPFIRYDQDWWGREPKTISRAMYDFVSVVLAWDKRRNRIKWATYKDTVYLPDYDGSTVWQKFDKNAAGQAIIEKYPAKDRDGNVLTAGDRVVYINTRYGGGAILDRGTSKEIKVSVTSRGKQWLHTTHVLIDNDRGEQSDIRQSQDSVLKLPVN